MEASTNREVLVKAVAKSSLILNSLVVQHYLFENGHKHLVML